MSNLGIMDVTDPNFLILSGVFQHVLFLYVDFFSRLCLFLKVYKCYGELRPCITCETSADIHVCCRPHTKIC